jgi:hypothetical protein
VPLVSASASSEETRALWTRSFLEESIAVQRGSVDCEDEREAEVLEPDDRRDAPRSKKPQLLQLRSREAQRRSHRLHR